MDSRSFAVVALCSVTMGCIAGLAASAAQPSQLFVGTRTGQPALRAQVEKIPAVAQTILNAQRQPLQEIPETSVAQSAPHAWSLASLLAPLVAFAGLAVWGLSGGGKKQSLADLEHGQWAMAASQAELRKRLASVKNSKKITDAMKLVASAKLRRAQEAVVQSRPFSEALQGVFGEVIRRIEGTDAAADPLLKDRDIKSITLIIIGGDRGLCGGYNNQLIKRSSIRFNELLAQGYNVNCITIGRKVTSWYKNRASKYPMVASYECNTAVPKVPQMVEELLASYLSGQTDTVELLYTNFVSLVKSNPGTRSLLPFKPTSATKMEVDEVCRLTTRDGKLAVECEPGEVPKNLLEADMLFEQPAQEILDSLIPLYLNSQLVRTLQESVASELAARMSSMQNASDNAKELSRQLNLQYNRIRQASVTSSLLEIVAGATAAS